MRLVAFLRAINVGGRVVKMDALRRHFEALGFQDVETFIASGNVVFESRSLPTAGLERKIEAGLARALGYEVKTFLRTAAEVAAIAGHAPFPAGEVRGAHAVYVGLFAEPIPSAAAKAVVALGSDVDALHVHGRELYWLCRSKLSGSKLSYAAIEKALKAAATFRNMTTITRLVDKHGSGASGG